MHEVHIEPQEWSLFYALRERLFKLIEKVDEGYHKSYEGAIDLTIGFPSYFDDEPPVFILNVHCYLLIDGRHKEYRSELFRNCLHKFEFDLAQWEEEWESEC